MKPKVKRLGRDKLLVGVVLVLAACSSEVDVGDLEVTVNDGGRLLTEDISIVVPPAAVIADREFVVISAETEIPGAVSRLFSITPSDIVTQKPFAVSIPVTTSSDTPLQVGLVGTDGTVIARYPAIIDPISGEARADVPHLGSFVVIAPLEQPAQQSIANPSLPGSELEFKPGDFSPNPSVQPAAQANDFGFVGRWQGTGEYAGLTMAFEPETFQVFQDGNTVRSGSYRASNGLVELTDATGQIESGTYNIENLGDRLVFNLQSGQLVWDKEDAGSQEIAQAQPSQSAQGQTPHQTAPEPQAQPQTQNQQASQGPEQKKGLFGQIGSGLRNIGGRAVEGVKNVGVGIGNQFKRDTEQQVEQAAKQADPDAVLAQVEAQANQHIDGAVNDISGNQNVASNSGGHPVFQTPLAGVTPSLPGGNPCLVDRATLEQILGFSLNEPRVIPGDESKSTQQASCEFLSLSPNGSVSIDFHKRKYGRVVPETWQRELRNNPDRYRRVTNLGDDARWTYSDNRPARLEVEVLLGNSILSVERKGGNSYASTLSSQDAPKVIEIAKRALSKLGR